MDTIISALPPATLATSKRQALSASTPDFSYVTEFDTRLAALLPQLADLPDSQLIQLATHARRLETCAFRLRGACVAEMRRRLTNRLAGGRGQRDTAGVGIKAQLTQLATQIGVSITTLKTDGRIHEVFFAGETGLAREPTLPREYYVIALGAPNPLRAIRTAHQRSADPAYRREQFRRDVRALIQTTQTSAAKITPTAVVQSAPDQFVKLTPAARHALTKLLEQSAQSPEAVVAAALLAYYAARSTDTIDPPIAPAAASTRRRRPNDTPPRYKQPLLPSLQRQDE